MTSISSGDIFILDLSLLSLGGSQPARNLRRFVQSDKSALPSTLSL
jgi:hypothetical protein